jgi:hypothetical protein
VARDGDLGLFSLTLVALLGRAVGYSLTLAGVAGVIVSLGIAADSYIVFYERLKDEVRKGKTPRAAVAPAFASAWRTILAANTVTIVAAVILYLLAIGSVRGFAFTLGLATMLDLFVVWFFKRPTVFLIARNRRLSELRGMGLRSGVAQEAAYAFELSAEIPVRASLLRGGPHADYAHTEAEQQRKRRGGHRLRLHLVLLSAYDWLTPRFREGSPGFRREKGDWSRQARAIP